MNNKEEKPIIDSAVTLIMQLLIEVTENYRAQLDYWRSNSDLSKLALLNLNAIESRLSRFIELYNGDEEIMELLSNSLDIIHETGIYLQPPNSFKQMENMLSKDIHEFNEMIEKYWDKLPYLKINVEA